MALFGDGLDQAVQRAFTRPVPKSAGAQMRYLVKQLKGTKAVAQMLLATIAGQIRDLAEVLVPGGWFRMRELTTFVDGFGQHFGDQRRGNVDENRQRFGRLPGRHGQPRRHVGAGMPAAAARG